MMEIAISLAVIGIALVAIIGVLPIGMNVQQANRQETIIGEDSSVFMNAIRNGTLGLDDLTNYVYAITNYWAQYAPGASTSGRGTSGSGGIVAQGVNGYTFALASVASGYPSGPAQPLTSAANIIGLLSTPEYIAVPGDGIGDVAGQPIPSLEFGGISNHIVAYCYSVSGPAIEKPPQDNPILRQDSFGYRIFCVNAPEAIDTNVFYQFAGPWEGGIPYGEGEKVFYDWTYWGSLLNGNTRNVPYPQSPYWAMSPDFTLEMALNSHEIRLTFEWPQFGNGNVGSGRETFRTLVAGQLMHQPPLNPLNSVSSIWYNTNLYYYLPQSFTNTP